MLENVEWLRSRQVLGQDYGLARVNYLLDQLGRPQDHLKIIHIGGTNGKGSTNALIANIMQAHGQKVGTYTSPAITSYTEQIEINGEPITLERLDSLLGLVRPLVFQMDQDDQLAHMTEFELMTAVMYLYFDQEQVDFAVVEVGMGGTLDATNVITPLVSVITTVDYDHLDLLGHSLYEIATNKAGIIKSGVPAVVGDLPEEALRAVKDRAELMNASLYRLGEDFRYEILETELHGNTFDYVDSQRTLNRLEIRLAGSHQMANAAVAIQVVFLLAEAGHIKLAPLELRAGLAKAQLPARLEEVVHRPQIILDGAHNPLAIRRLIQYIETELSDRTVKLLVSIINTKDYQQMIHQLESSPVVDQVILTTFDYPRALTPDQLADLYHTVDTDQRFSYQADWQRALGELLAPQPVQGEDAADLQAHYVLGEKPLNEDYEANYHPSDKVSQDELTIIITGSFYFLTQVRPYLLKQVEEGNI